MRKPKPQLRKSFPARHVDPLIAEKFVLLDEAPGGHPHLGAVRATASANVDAKEGGGLGGSTPPSVPLVPYSQDQCGRL